MKLKRILTLLLAMALVIFSLAACGSKTTDTPAETEAPAAEDAGDETQEYSADMFNETDGQGGPEAVVINNGEITAVQNGDLVSMFGLIGSWSSGGVNVDDAGEPILTEDNDYLYTSAIAIINGDSTSFTNPSLYTGNFDEKSASDIVIEDSTSGHNGITLLNVGDFTINNATITMKTSADGTDTCDFSGKGTAILASGDSNVTVENSIIETEGVATMPIFCDVGATVTMKNSTLISLGGTLYGDYMNTPDQALMVAPPWILGIMGTSRCTNLMGTDSTMNFIDTDTSSGAWAVLSTDSGTNMYLNMYNTTLTLLNANEAAASPIQEPTNSKGGASEVYETVDNPYTTNSGAGYGTYVIGSAVEVFAGCEINVGTYASIFTGGSATYTSITEGETYTLASATGKTDVEYTATATKNTVINSDTFGFMIHQSEDSIVIEKGTEINSGFATFLVKSGSSGETVTATVDDAVINNGGVLIQVMDNDDATTGGMMDVDDERNLNGGFMNFQPEHNENAGFYTGTSESDGSTQDFTFTNGAYDGNIYNASGSDNSDNGPLGATTLNVTIGAGAVLNGAVASTSAIHVTYDGSVAIKAQGGYAYNEATASEILEYQNTSYDMTHYFDQGHVANLIYYNGANDINVTLTDDAIWNVTGESLITSISLSKDATVIVASGATLTVNGVTYEAGTYTADNF